MAAGSSWPLAGSCSSQLADSSCEWQEQEQVQEQHDGSESSGWLREMARDGMRHPQTSTVGLQDRQQPVVLEAQNHTLNGTSLASRLSLNERSLASRLSLNERSTEPIKALNSRPGGPE